MGIISPNYATTDNLPDEFKNTEDYQILEFENSRKEVMGKIKEFTVKEISYEFKECIKK